MSRLLLTGAFLVTGTGSGPGDLLVENESIAEVGRLGDRRGDADEHIDLSGHVVMPGIIDPHVHFEEPGHPERERYVLASYAGLAGGVTTFFEHPFSVPLTSTADRLRRKRDWACTQACSDFGLWGAATPDNAGDLAGMHAAGAAGFKAFTVASEPELPPLQGGRLSEAMEQVASLRSTLVVHAEDEDMVGAISGRLRRAGRRDVWAHQEAHPPQAEVAAVEDAVARAEKSRCRLQVAHVSTEEGLEIAARAAARGAAVAAEVAPHHLLLSEDDVSRLGPWVKTTPPLRPKAMAERLWVSVTAGLASFFGSDHAPWTRAEKEAGFTDIWQAGNGIPALQHMAPLLLTEWERRGLPLERFAAMSSGNFARWMGLARKGRLTTGADADLVIFRRGVDEVISASDMLTVQKWSPYEGRHVTWKVSATMLRGRWAYRVGEARTGHRGAFIRLPQARHRPDTHPRAPAVRGDPA